MRGSPDTLVAEPDHKTIAHNKASHESFAAKLVPHALHKGGAGGQHGRHLASTEKYVTSSVGGSAYTVWETAECESTNYMSMYASDTTTKYIVNNSPTTTTTESSASFQITTYTDCDETSAMVTSAAFDIYADSDAESTLVVASKLGSGSFSATATTYVSTQSCFKVCGPDSEEDDNEDANDNDGISCWYGNCTTISELTGTGDLEVNWVGNSIPSNSSSKSKYNSVAYNSRSSSTGQDRGATPTVTFSFEGDAFDFPADANFTASLQRYNSTDITITK